MLAMIPSQNGTASRPSSERTLPSRFLGFNFDGQAPEGCLVAEHKYSLKTHRIGTAIPDGAIPATMQDQRVNALEMGDETGDRA